MAGDVKNLVNLQVLTDKNLRVTFQTFFKLSNKIADMSASIYSIEMSAYSDDIVFVATNIQSLQITINKIKEYCFKVDL